MLPVRSLRMFTPALFALVALAVPGCASDDAQTEEPSDEAALVELGKFVFRPNSPEEKAGRLDARNAYGAAVLAKLVYLHEEKAPMARALKELGVDVKDVDDVIMFEAKKSGLDPRTNPIINGTNGMYVKTRDAGFLVFRGSEDGVLQDAITNARVAGANPGGLISNNRAGKGQAHAGYFFGVKAMWSQVRDRIASEHGDNGRSKLPLYVIGHSLGGAMAQIAMHHLLFDSCIGSIFKQLDAPATCEKEFIPVTALYAFGSPRIGDEEFATTLAERAKQTSTRVFRFVNEKDQVSMLPRYVPIRIGDEPVLAPYRHLGVGGDEREFAFFLGHDGEVVAPAPAPKECKAEVTIGPLALSHIVQCDLSAKEFIEGIAAGKPPWRNEHSMMLYKEKLRGLLQITLLDPTDPKGKSLREELKGQLERLRQELVAARNNDSR